MNRPLFLVCLAKIAIKILTRGLQVLSEDAERSVKVPLSPLTNLVSIT